jgi:predicted short-subunit dehydrogenase-like oxidoreductase (DUF2520 family)
MRNDKSSIAIIGPGRVGLALGRLLADYGGSIIYVAARELAHARRAARFIGQGEPVGLADPRLPHASIFLLTTSDSALAQVAKDLAKRGSGRMAWHGKIVLHTCGSLSSAVLRPLKLRGASIGALHPFQTVPSPRAGVRSLLRCFWGIEGDPRAVRLARHWVRLLEGVPFPVRPGGKTLYHLSAFLVCPTVVTLMEQSFLLLGKAGVPPRIAVRMLRQFVAETAKNFAEMGARRALTGPAVRGDWATIERHRSALQHTAPEFVPVYEALLQAMLRLAGRKAPK